MPTTICFINQKGGCGKSSSCFHLGGFLAGLGYRVLLVDADPQASLSQGLLGPTVVEQFPASRTLSALFDQELFRPSLETLIQPTPFERLSLLPANHLLGAHNLPQPESRGMQQFTLESALAEYTRAEIVLIDCPPNLYQCSWNAMLAADWIVIPVPPEDFGAQGLPTVHQAIAHARSLNPRLELLGHLVTRYDSRLVIHREFRQRIFDRFPSQTLATVIPEAAAFKVALACRTPVNWYAPRSKAAKLTSELSHEILRRMKGQSEIRRAL